MRESFQPVEQEGVRIFSSSFVSWLGYIWRSVDVGTSNNYFINFDTCIRKEDNPQGFFLLIAIISALKVIMLGFLGMTEFNVHKNWGLFIFFKVAAIWHYLGVQWKLFQAKTILCRSNWCILLKVVHIRDCYWTRLKLLPGKVPLDSRLVQENIFLRPKLLVALLEVKFSGELKKIHFWMRSLFSGYHHSLCVESIASWLIWSCCHKFI